MPKLGSLQPHLTHLLTLSRFGLVGIVNTGIGLSIITALDLGLHLDSHLANAAGYAAGMVSGFLLNRSFVFRSGGRLGRTGAKWVVAVGVAFLLNQSVLALALDVYGDAAFARLAAQLTAMASYTLVLFTLCKLWVFRLTAPAAP
jgi:putative flippase GtrA